MEQLQSLWRTTVLERWPVRQGGTLRAWDAADEYLLEQLAESGLALDDHPLLFNDGFGALAVSLADFSPTSVSDSWISHQATRYNLACNGLGDGVVRLLDSLESLPSGATPVVLKIPKSHALLEYQLVQIRQLMQPGETLLAGAMAKHIHRSTLQLFERIIGPTRTSLAKKKARLVFAEFDAALSPPINPFPQRFELPEYGLTVSNHANVFSRDKLDIGTRFFLQHLPQPGGTQTIIDLGCGNGLLGIVAARMHAKARVLFVDESHMAVDSARINAAQLQGAADRLTFRVTHCLDGVEPGSADLILNNPPFHQQHAVGDEVAWQMFLQSHRVLSAGGELHVVGNRHLGYHAKLKRLFGNCTMVASNQKFVILKAVKQTEKKKK